MIIFFSIIILHPVTLLNYLLYELNIDFLGHYKYIYNYVCVCVYIYIYK